VGPDGSPLFRQIGLITQRSRVQIPPPQPSQLAARGPRFPGPLALYGRSEHRSEISLQVDSLRPSAGVMTMASMSPRSASVIPCASLDVPGPEPASSPSAVQRGHLGMEQGRRRVGGGEFGLQLLASGCIRVQRIFDFTGGDAPDQQFAAGARRCLSEALRLVKSDQ
jgi:hypothetical protein